MAHRRPDRGLARVCAIALSLASSGGAAADRDDADAARVDWAAGRVTAGGTGIADRHAPSPAIALGTSRRTAAVAAKQRIAAKLEALPLAAGGTVGSRLAEPGVKARLAAAVDAAITLAAEPETDGSWHVTLAVPLEAVRQALDQPRAVPPDGDGGPPVIVVDGVAAAPAIGWTVGGGAAATVWTKQLPAWAKDAPRVVARSARSGAIDVARGAATAATLFVILAK